MRPVDLKGASAVVTGGASGIGLAIADRFGSAGAQVVLADIEQAALDAAVEQLREAGITVSGVRTDVSDAEQFAAMARIAAESHGPVDLAFLNAGVAAGGFLPEVTLHDWEWTLGVNLWGVIHGVATLLPGMVERNRGHLVITASVAGHTAYPFMGPYNASKHAVVGLAETLYHELHMLGSAVGTSVLCPGIVNTNILDSARNRPEHLTRPLSETERIDSEAIGELARSIYAEAIGPEDVAEMVYDAVVSGDFYIFTDDAFDEVIATRHGDIARRRNPTPRPILLEDVEPRRR